MEETLKRYKTSPRTNTINDVVAIIDTDMATYTQNGSFDAATALHNLREKVVALIGTQHAVKSEKQDKQPKAPRITGTHFVGETEDGKVLYLRRDKEGTYHTDSGDMETLTHVYGAWRTEEGARWAIEHNEYQKNPQVM